MIPNDLLHILACPVCKGTLTLDAGNNTLRCGTCKTNYPIRDGIPILLPDEARSDS